MKKIFGIVLVVLAMGTMVGTASASDFYVTGSVTNTHVKGDAARENGAGVGIGYSYNSWLAAEVTYNYIGTIGGNKVQAATVWAVVDPTVATIGSMPLKVTARAGYTRAKVDGAGYDNGVAYGAGLALGITNDIDVTIGYDRREVDFGGKQKVDTASLGLKYNF